MLLERPLKPLATPADDQRIEEDCAVPLGQDKRLVLRDRPPGRFRERGHAEVRQLRRSSSAARSISAFVGLSTRKPSRSFLRRRSRFAVVAMIASYRMYVKGTNVSRGLVMARRNRGASLLYAAQGLSAPGPRNAVVRCPTPVRIELDDVRIVPDRAAGQLGTSRGVPPKGRYRPLGAADQNLAHFGYVARIKRSFRCVIRRYHSLCQSSRCSLEPILAMDHPLENLGPERFHSFVRHSW